MNKASPSQVEVTHKAGKAAIGQRRFFARIGPAACRSSYLLRRFQCFMVGQWLAQAREHFLWTNLPKFAAPAIPIFHD
jgi:hypothetical protein